MNLLITLLLGAFIILGALAVHLFKRHEIIEQVSIAFACGTMVMLVILDLLPEAFEAVGGGRWYLILLFTLLGLLLLKLLDHWVPDHDDAHGTHHDCTEENVMHIGIMSSVAVLLHNMIEGMAVYSLAMESTRMGLLVALGVGLHNIPMGMIITATLEHEPRRFRWTVLAVAAVSTFLGGLVMHLLSFAVSPFLLGVLIALTLGMLLYIIIFELVPHLLHSPNKKLSIICALAGMALILVSTLFE